MCGPNPEEHPGLPDPDGSRDLATDGAGLPLDLEETPRAVDTHAHQPTANFLHDGGGEIMRDAATKFGADLDPGTSEEMIEAYRAAGVRHTVLLGWDAETNTGNPPVPNEHVAEMRDEYPDFFTGFASVDPHKDDWILLAHPAFPWERQQLAICQQKGNVYMDLSG